MRQLLKSALLFVVLEVIRDQQPFVVGRISKMGLWDTRILQEMGMGMHAAELCYATLRDISVVFPCTCRTNMNNEGDYDSDATTHGKGIWEHRWSQEIESAYKLFNVLSKVMTRLYMKGKSIFREVI